MDFKEDDFIYALQETIGSYDWGQEAEILLPGTDREMLVNGTIYHETTHLVLCTSTTYGLFQKILYGLLKAKVNKLDNTYKHMYYLFKKAMGESRELHEGVATYCQLKLISVMNSKELAEKTLEQKPELYRKGYLIFKGIVDNLSIPFLEEDDVAKVCASCMLNTNIVYSMVNIFDEKDGKIEKSIGTDSPNQRMLSFYNYTRDKSNVAALKGLIYTKIHETMGRSLDLTKPVKEDLRSYIFSIFKSCVNSLVFEVFGDGEQAFLLNYMANVVNNIREEAMGLSFFEYGKLSFEIKEIKELENNMHFRQKNINIGNSKVSERPVTAQEAIEYLVVNLDEDKHIFHIHIFNPFQNNRFVIYKGKNDKIIEDPFIILNRCERESEAVDITEFVIRMEHEDIKDFFRELSTENVVVTSSLIYFDPKYVKESDALSEIATFKEIYFYLMDSSFEFLKELSLLNFPERRVKYVAYEIMEQGLNYIFFIEQAGNIRYFTPISKLNLMKYMEWAKDNPELIADGVDEFKNKTMESELLRFVVNHYGVYGY